MESGQCNCEKQNKAAILPQIAAHCAHFGQSRQGKKIVNGITDLLPVSVDVPVRPFVVSLATQR